jgi:hypothetical protein
MDEYVRIGVETDVTYLKVLSKHLSGDTDRNHEKVSEPAIQQRLDPNTCRLQIQSVTILTDLLCDVETVKSLPEKL